MKLYRHLTLLLLTAAALLALWGCVPPDQVLRFVPESYESVKIGVVLPLSGADALQGKKMLRGAQFAAEELNNRRGHFGRTVELLVEDSCSTGEGAAAALEKAVRAGAVGIVGGHSTVEVQSMTALARRHRVPLVIPMATGDDDVIGKNPFVFRVVFTDQQQSEMIAGFMKYYRRVKRVAVAVSTDPADVYSRNVARDVADSFRELGGEITCISETDKKDPAPAMKQARSLVPDAIVLPFSAELAAKCYKILRESGYSGLICGPDTWDDPEFFRHLQGLKNVGSNFYTAFFSSEARHIEFIKFWQEFRKKYFYYPGSCEIQTFDALNMLLTGFGNNAASLRSFNKNWRGMRKHSAVAGIYTMTPDNGIDRTIYINRIGRSPETGDKPIPKNITGLQYSRLEDYSIGVDKE